MVRQSTDTHAGKTKLVVWLENDELAKFDAALKEQGYTTRAEWFREKVRETTRVKV